MSMDASSELAQIATRFDLLAHQSSKAEIADPLDRLHKAAEEVGKSASGSWIGYQAYVYYGQFEAPPAGAHFDQAWGLMPGTFSSRTSEHWIEHHPDDIVAEVYRRAGNPDLALARRFNDEAHEKIDKIRSSLLSIIQVHVDQEDPYLESIRERVNDLNLMGKADVEERLAPREKIRLHDELAVNQGRKTPPHLSVLSEVIAINHTRSTIKKMNNVVNYVQAHLSRRGTSVSNPTTGNVFIGHGRTDTWRQLKDFIESLGLSTDEFNRVPVAGVSNTERLEQMLKTAAMAFLVMTGEDEQHDGKSHARLNVVHEAGLFQGKLGFKRAIILLEDECEEFSNIAGHGQLRFRKGDIQSTFNKVKEVLEREDVLKT